MYKIGISTCGDKKLDSATFAACYDAGIYGIEISLPEGTHGDTDLRPAEKLSSEYGIKLWSYHLPFSPFSKIDISSENPEIRDFSIKYLKELIAKAGSVGIDKFIIHPSGEPIYDRRDERIKRSKESLCELAKTAVSAGGVIAVENLPRTCLGKNSDEILELISSDTSLRVCFDTNHLLGEKAVDFIEKTGEKIITLHVSDYDFLNERHWLPGEGKIDWNQILCALGKAGYNGIWLYEISLCAPKSIHRSRDLTYSDFTRNAAEIFSGQKPTVFSVPAEGLKAWNAP